MSPFVTCSASAMFCDRTTVSGESEEPSSPVTEEPAAPVGGPLQRVVDDKHPREEAVLAAHRGGALTGVRMRLAERILSLTPIHRLCLHGVDVQAPESTRYSHPVYSWRGAVLSSFD